MLVRIIHSGKFSLLRNALIVSKRLINFLRFSPCAFSSASCTSWYSDSKSTSCNRRSTASAPV